IVRNKAAEKAKHAHQVATSAGSSSSPGGPVSVIAHAPSTQLTEARSGGYSINGILGLQHDPNGNSIKRKRIDDHDENRDLNGHHDDDIKRQRFQYNGDPLCSNCNVCHNHFQLWPSSKWSIKDEHKLLSELGGAGTTTGQTGGYYDPHGGFAGVTGVTSAADIYDTINTMSQAGQNLYTPPLAGSLGSSSLTPLAPITMHEMKIETTRLMDPTKYDPSMSPYHSGTTVVPGTDYAYSTAYSQYGAAYGTYGYGSASSGLLNSYYYTNNDIAITNPDEQTSRSPTAATRANSLAPANSPTESGSACLKTEAIYPHELNM
ncbi:hypothetical protein YQE_12360, partial [Dendroctonus ponderosae]